MRCVISAAGALAALASVSAAWAQAPLPWEVWRDLRRVAVAPEGDQVELRSSHCLSGCGLDRHSEGDERFIRVDGDEGVIFEERGPGAVVRIWMTTGDSGASLPLDPATSIRFYFDGEATPRIDLPLPALFDGTQPPFLPPLVGDRLVSSGGNFSYVPIPFQQSCRIALAGDLTQRLWFQLGFHRLAPELVVETFTGAEDLSGLSALLRGDTTDPWPPGSGSTTAGSVELEPAVAQVVWAAAGGGTVTELTLDLPPAEWPSVWATMVFDGVRTVELPLSDLFGAGAANPIHSLWLRADVSGELTSFFPMPYSRTASLALTKHQGAGVSVNYRVRADESQPVAGSGRFAAELAVSNPSTVGLDHVVLGRQQPGKWVGLYAELGSVATTARQYLEGDERIFVDGLRHPSLYGTGTEDFFNGGFYFDQGPFSLALHGLLEQGVTPANEHASVAYRFLLTDAVPYGQSIRVGLEGGPESDLAIRARTVAYYYLGPEPPLMTVDILDLGDPVSRADHGYGFSGVEETRTLDGLFEGEPPLALTAIGTYHEEGIEYFQMDASRCTGGGGLRLRRLWDAGVEGQRFDLTAAGEAAAGTEFTLGNEARRWTERDFDLPAVAVGGELVPFEVAAQPAGATAEFTAFTYELLCRGPGGEIFADGFETGDLSGWSGSVESNARP
jgi:hypothetical protein